MTNLDKYRQAARVPDVRERLARRSSTTDAGCILWTGALSSSGYGVIVIEKVTLYVHRLAYSLVRPLVDGMVIDHLCRTPACINPAHLQLVTTQVNSARSKTARRTHCPSGHEYTAENTRINLDRLGRPHRNCIACATIRNRARATRPRLLAVE